MSQIFKTAGSTPPTPGDAVKVVAKLNKSPVTSTVPIPIGNTPPLITEGTSYDTLQFTPDKIGNLLEISFSSFVGATAKISFTVALFQQGQSDALAAIESHVETGGNLPLFLRFYQLVTSIAARTYEVRFGPKAPSTESIYMCASTDGGSEGQAVYGDASVSYLAVKEYENGIIIP